MSEIVTVIVERPINVTHISRGQASTVSTQRVVQTNVVPQPVIIQKDTTIGVVNDKPSKVTIQIPGQPGPEGPEGPVGPVGPAGGTSFIYPQPTPSTDWLIVHNLNRYPSITVVDSSGNLVVGSVGYIDANTVEVTFTYAMTGSAYLN